MKQSLFPICFLLLSSIACGTSSPASLVTPTSLFGSAPPPTAPATIVPGTSWPPANTAPAAEPQFAVSVIVDATMEQVSEEQARAVISEASGYLREFSPYGLVMIDFVQDRNGGSTSDMVSRYMATRSAFPPNGVVVFSAGDNQAAKTSGGYGFNLPLGGSFKNAFVSPATGANQLYVAVADYNYKYMACGYGGGDNVQSATSLPGECRGQTGITCVSNNGYSMCSNAVGNLYTSTPTHAVSSMIVHGLLHNFGPNGDQDHYATPECNARMGYPQGFFDLQESEYYNGLCPFVYEEFTKSYSP
jgi:hypothetical protein